MGTRKRRCVHGIVVFRWNRRKLPATPHATVKDIDHRETRPRTMGDKCPRLAKPRSAKQARPEVEVCFLHSSVNNKEIENGGAWNLRGVRTLLRCTR